MIEAASNGRTEGLKLLLSAGADINHDENVFLSRIVSTDKSQTFLWAAYNGNSEAVKLLLSAGADINHTDKVLLSCIAWTDKSQDRWTALRGYLQRSH